MPPKKDDGSGLEDIPYQASALLSNVESHVRIVITTVLVAEQTRGEPAKLALSQTAVALSLGTLLVHGARLRGCRWDDPLMELNMWKL
jgi:hypothetical protein